MESQKKHVMILGATGHIAKSLVERFCGIKQKYHLFLYSRRRDNLEYVFNILGTFSNDCHFRDYTVFGKDHTDIIINCAGVGTPEKVKILGKEIITLTEKIDDLVLAYINEHPHVIYINLSSGAIFGEDFTSPVSEKSKMVIENISKKNYYAVAKFNAETRHRRLKHLNIIDLRVFSFFSRHIDLNADFLLTDIINCIKNGSEFQTDSNNIVRDYVHPDDLFDLVERCISLSDTNDVFDVYSRSPVTKTELLAFFEENYNLKYTINNERSNISPTGMKSNYYSINRKAQKLGYIPKYSSLNTIAKESEHILGMI
ncbi:NAD(P)-dependent oxidoreductase [bacterium]|nr:NAD(P)-dependent oxidoreductase [bacterium]